MVIRNVTISFTKDGRDGLNVHFDGEMVTSIAVADEDIRDMTIVDDMKDIICR